MAPDLNSLPPSSQSQSPTNMRGQSPSPSPRSPSLSLQATAAVNAGLQHESNPRRSSSITTRRRSQVLMNLQSNDPTVPAPGEMVDPPSTYRTSSPQPGSPSVATGDPHHYRTPSLGEIHQEIEQEQEAQVNRLLQMIRTQQEQLQQLQIASGQAAPPVIDESTPTSERSMSFSNPILPPLPSTVSTPRSPTTAFPIRSSFDIARSDLHRRSRTPSRTASPRLGSTAIAGEGGEQWNLGGRDESAFYQAETQMMVRENQMLRQRIRELERQVNDLHANAAITREPVTSSHLLRSTSVSEETSGETSGGVEPAAES